MNIDKIKLYFINKDSPGMIFWNDNGFFIYKELENFIRNILFKNSYIEVKTPILLNKKIWEKSEHLSFFKENIFFSNDNKNEYCIKPMNCPAHILLFKNILKSYKDLPIRISEFGTCHRLEPSGSLYKLMRTRVFNQDDAHIFCKENDIYNEILNCLEIMFNVYKKFNFSKIDVFFSTKPTHKIGNDNIWNISENIILDILNKKEIKFEYKYGEGAFYGPKIEFILNDSMNKKWQCGTIQLDFFLSNKLNVFYIDKNNNKIYPIIIHRAILGSIERFIGILEHHYNYNYPLWLSPIQIIIINITKDDINYIYKLYNEFINNNIRVKLDIGNKKLEYKIRKYELLYIPYILICGKKESCNNTISIRDKKSNTLYSMNYKDFINKVLYEINNKINYE